MGHTQRAGGATPLIVGEETPERRSPRLHEGAQAPRPTGEPNSARIPLHQPNIITQAAVDELTANVYYGAHAACWMPNKYLQFDPANTNANADIEHFCAPVVHPVTGETITSYKKLAKDQVTSDTWTTGFGKEFGKPRGTRRQVHLAWMPSG